MDLTIAEVVRQNVGAVGPFAHLTQLMNRSLFDPSFYNKKLMLASIHCLSNTLSLQLNYIKPVIICQYIRAQDHTKREGITTNHDKR
jgi:hypothetical protein